MGNIAIVARFKRQLEYVQNRLNKKGLECVFFTDSAPQFSTDRIKLITMHSIKGLEFPLVFLIGLDERVMPYLTDTDERAKHEEAVKERKLMYVGMTRATEMLYLMSSARPSAFIADITPKYLRMAAKSRLKRFYNIAVDQYRFKNKLLDPHHAEEKIRQWMIAELLTNYGYPIDCFSIEFPVKGFSNKGYVDIAIQINKKNTVVPFIFIETKRGGHSMADALDQVKSYMSNCHLCEYGAATDGNEFIVIDRNFQHCDDLPVFKPTWGLSNTIRYTYTNIKTDWSSIFCFDPNQPNSLELDHNGDCEILEGDQIAKLTVYGSIAAGQQIAMNPEMDQNVYLPKNWVQKKDCFALKVRGDSMTGAKIDDGDLVVVHSQTTAENRDVVVVGIQDEGMLKRFNRMGEKILLLSENPKYEPLMLSENQVNIMGVAIGLIKWGGV